MQEGLKRKSLFPIQEDVDEYGRAHRWREITFQGTRQAAIDLLGSRYNAAQLLVARRLVSDGAAALMDVVAAIESNLFRAKVDILDAFGQQERLIEVLGILENHRSDGEVVRMIDKMLTQVRQGASFPFDDKKLVDDEIRNRHSYGGLNSDVNHSLAWLLMSLPEREAARLFGTR